MNALPADATAPPQPDNGATRVDVFIVPSVAIDTGVLDSPERARAARFRQQADRARYVAAHTALRILVGKALDRPPATVRFDAEPCPLCGDDHGRPTIVGGGALQFSLSHTSECSVIALADGLTTGVDVERADRELDPGDLRTTIHPDEPTPTNGTAGLRHWVRKEAYLKGIGTGLGVDPATVDLSRDPPGWSIIDLAIDGHVAALALHSEAPVDVATHQLDSELRQTRTLGILYSCER